MKVKYLQILEVQMESSIMAENSISDSTRIIKILAMSSLLQLLLALRQIKNSEFRFHFIW